MTSETPAHDHLRSAAMTASVAGEEAGVRTGQTRLVQEAVVGRPATLAGAVRDGAHYLAAMRVEAPRADARLLLQHALGIDRLTVLTARSTLVDPAGLDRYEVLLTRRAGAEPVSRITGRREFWAMDFRVSPAVLDPRADSETIVEAALAMVDDRDAPLSILDLGVGSGCLLLALLSELPNAWGLGIDISEPALRVARENARRHGLGDRALFLCGDWASAIRSGFDIVVANPPYIRTGDIEHLAPEVSRFDPTIALDGGADGLAAYRKLMVGLSECLDASGSLVLEVGAGQELCAAEIASAGDFCVIEARRDLAGIERCVTARKKAFGMLRQYR